MRGPDSSNSYFHSTLDTRGTSSISIHLVIREVPTTAKVAPRRTTGVATEARHCWALVANSSARARACPLLLIRDLASSKQLTSAAASRRDRFTFFGISGAVERKMCKPASGQHLISATAVDRVHRANIGHTDRGEALRACGDVALHCAKLHHANKKRCIFHRGYGTAKVQDC